MDKLRAIKLFARVSEPGSFTRVAEETGAVKPLISKGIIRLEKDIGARLLHRSTRQLQLTELGRDYLQRCRGGLCNQELPFPSLSPRNRKVEFYTNRLLKFIF